jgi:hypothetical protein
MCVKGIQTPKNSSCVGESLRSVEINLTLVSGISVLAFNCTCTAMPFAFHAYCVFVVFTSICETFWFFLLAVNDNYSR